MELTVRDWMLVIGAVLILAVLLDALRRILRQRRETVRLAIKKVPEGSDDDLALYKELPNGGARLVNRDLVAATNQSRADKARAKAGRAAVPPRPTQRPAAARQPTRKPAAAAAAAAAAAPAPAPAAATPVRNRRSTRQPAPTADLFDDEVPLVEGLSVGAMRADLEFGLSPLQPLAEEIDTGLVPAPLPEAEEEDVEVRDEPTEVHLLHVAARSVDGFAGDDILHILLSCDMRFGDMNFFHRHEESAGRGIIEFSVANMVQPGVFDLDAMADFRTPGLIFFLTLPGPRDINKAFDEMLEAARYVAEHLGGDVLDESRSVLTRQTLEHTRQQLQDFERRQLAQSRR